MVFGGLMLTFCGGLTVVALLLSITLGSRLEQQYSAQVALVDDYENFQSTFFYDRNGTVIYEAFSEGRRTNVSLADIPQVLIDATIAVEDDTFYSNPGVDVPATTRAFLQYVGLSEGDTGGSTITQQVVKNILFEPEYRIERSVNRKVEEIILALLLTGTSLNIYSQIGLVLLIGLMAKNSVLVVEFADQLRDRGLDVREAIERGAARRFRPVVMTLMSTILGALPLILSTGAGSEARSAIGWVVFGGLALAAVFTLYLTPALYSLLAPLSKARAAETSRLRDELDHAVSLDEQAAAR